MSPGGDWARGPARYVAAAVVVAGGVAGLAWSLLVAPTPLPGPVVYVERAPEGWVPADRVSAPPPAPAQQSQAQAPPAGDTSEGDSPRNTPEPAGLRVNPNTATPAELQLLPGIGPARARAIVEERQQRGPFDSVEDLARVHGIGPVTVERLRPYVRFRRDDG